MRVWEGFCEMTSKYDIKEELMLHRKSVKQTTDEKVQTRDFFKQLRK